MSHTAADLAELQAAGLIFLAAHTVDLEYLFRHALVQEAAYASLLRADRKRLHAAVGAILEENYPDRLAEFAPRLAHHFAAARDPARARRYYTLAADQALAAYANAEAEHHYRAALALAPAAAEQAALLAGLGEALARRGSYGESIATRRAAIRYYGDLGHAGQVARLYAQAARAAWWAGDPPASLALCREGLAATAGDADTADRAALLHETGRACYFNGQVPAARHHTTQALLLAEHLGDREIQAEALSTLAHLPDQTREAKINMLVRAVALADAADLPATGARAYNNLGMTITDRRLGRGYLLRAAALARRAGMRDLEGFALVNACRQAVLLGEFAAAAADLAVARALVAAGATPVAPHLALVEGVLLHCQGDWPAARARFQAGMEEARRVSDTQLLAGHACSLADLLLEQGALEEAAGALLGVLDVLRQVDPDDLGADALLSCVRARQGRLTEAHAICAQAAPVPAAAPDLLPALAALAVAEGRWADAWAAFARLAAAQADRPWYRARLLYEWAGARLACGTPADIPAARALLHEARDLFAALQVPPYVALVAARLAALPAESERPA